MRVRRIYLTLLPMAERRRLPLMGPLWPAAGWACDRYGRAAIAFQRRRRGK